MKNYFKANNVRVCITTDTWTSNAQKKSYMVIRKMIEECLLDWELPGVFTITLDNVSANDLVIDYLREDGHLKEQVVSSNGVLNTKFMQVRCAAHVLALVVNTSLGEYHMEVKRIREVVKYVMGSPARLARDDKAFKKKFCFNQRSIPSVFSTSTGASDDVDMKEACTPATDTNSGQQTHDKGNKKAPPPPPIHAPYMEDWVFYDLTVKFSYCTRVTSHEFLFNVSDIHRTMNTWVKSSDPFLSGMGSKMLDKFNKYWGAYEKMNTLMFIAVLFNPREKMKGLNFILDTLDITGPSLRKHLSTYVRTDFQEPFEEYKYLYANDENMSSATSVGDNVT
ncbi:hypothetical protein MKX03_028043 [Papaver bracteatum]|nr:hypothetical protein MKX03_028043 [Papaver bracteatum]